MTGNMVGRLRGACVAAVFLSLASNVQTQEVELYRVFKGQEFIQNGPGLAQVFLRDTPFEFEAELEADNEAEIFGVFLRNPDGGFTQMNEENGDFRLDRDFGADSALDNAFPAGQYAFFFQNGPPLTISLPQDAYPPPPHIANWAVLQAADPTSDLTMAWDPFAGAGPNDFIEVRLRGLSGGGDVFRTALFGTATSVVVPAGTLRANSIYTGRVRFFNVSQFKRNADGSIGVSGFYRETRFVVSTGVRPPPQGRVQFSNAFYFVREGAGQITLTITRTGGSIGYTEVTVTAFSLSAREGADYSHPEGLVVAFGNAITEQTVTIPIVDDSLFERNEQFQVRLTSPSGGLILGNIRTATITIIDNERVGAGAIQFSSLNYATAEGAGRALIAIVRSGPATLPASVRFRAFSGAATAGEDFNAISSVVSFARGQTVKLVAVPILNDAAPEGVETIQLELTNPSSGAVLGSRRVATLRILANDGFSP